MKKKEVTEGKEEKENGREGGKEGKRREEKGKGRRREREKEEKRREREEKGKGKGIGKKREGKRTTTTVTNSFFPLMPKNTLLLFHFANLFLLPSQKNVHFENTNIISLLLLLKV